MSKLYCENGHTYRTRDFNRAPDETHCPTCGGRLSTGMERNAKKKAEAKPKRKPMEKVTLTCPDCGREFERRKARQGTGKCIPCSQNHRPIRVVECVGCGETFETRETEQSYCGRRCYLKHAKPSQHQLDRAAEVGRKRTGSKNPNFRHGRRTSEHERRLHREFNLTKKGERACRVCGSERFPQAHHAVPRSLSRAGKYDLRNCLPLCAHCHSSWHKRALTIYRDAFTESEWAFVVTLINPGWLDERYPDRGAALRDDETPQRPTQVESPERSVA